MSNGPADPAPVRERFVEDLLEYMALEEKAGQLALTPYAGDDPAFHDQLRRGLIGGVVGQLAPGEAQTIQRIAAEETRLGIPLFIAMDTTQGLRTRLPLPISAANSWDLDAIEAAERLIAEEAGALGINWALAPFMGTAKFLADSGFDHSTGESSWLAANIAAARIRGLQAPDGPHHIHMLACLQLGPVDPRSNSGRGIDALTERLSSLATAIELAGPASIAPETTLSLGDANYTGTSETISMLKQPGSYDGMLLSDWVGLAERAGQLPGSPSFVSISAERLIAAVTDQIISRTEIDQAVRRVLAAKYDLGLFRSSFAPAQPEPAAPRNIRNPSLDLARKSIVLMRNDPALLPLTVDSGEVLVVGSAARDRILPMGGGQGEAASVIDGLEELGIACKFAPGLALRQDGTSIGHMIDADRMAIGMAGEAARRTRTVVCVLGDIPGTPGGALPEATRTLLETLRAANPRLVVVTLASRPIDPDIGGEPLPCLVHAGVLGTHSGQAIAEVLSGEHDPSGRLPYAIRTREGEERLPFGHGLSYADFALTDFAVELGVDRVLVSAIVSNLGEREGCEVSQLFVRKLEPDHETQESHLRGFTRVYLRPGNRECITFELGAQELGTVDAAGRRTVESGAYEIRLGFNEKRAQSGEVFVPHGVAEAMTSGRVQPDIAFPLVNRQR